MIKYNWRNKLYENNDNQSMQIKKAKRDTRMKDDTTKHEPSHAVSDTNGTTTPYIAVAQAKSMHDSSQTV